MEDSQPNCISVDVPKGDKTGKCGMRKDSLSRSWGTRHTLSLLGFLGFLLAYSMRFNLSLALVEMVDTSHVLLDNLQSKATEANSSSIINEDHEVCSHHLEIILGHGSNRSMGLLSSPSPPKVNSGHAKQKWTRYREAKFHWTEEEQGLILGSFFWGYIVTQYPGGKLSHMYGAKWIFSIGLLIAGVLSAFLPYVTITWGKNGLILLRILLGLAEGVIFPSMHVMIAHWAPPQERSRMTNIIFSGMPLGSALTMVSGGYLINYWGWPAMFWAVGGATLIWFICWSLLIYDYPSDHPRISGEELEAIQASIKGQSQKEHIPTPWASVITSPPVLAIFVVHVGHTWGHYLLHAEAPKYLHSVHGFKIEHNGWFSALPQLLNFSVCIIMSHFSDFLILKNWTSVLFTRRMCTTLAVWGSAAAFVGMILGGCNTLVAVFCLNIAGAVMGAGFGGWIVNLIDIAPNHAGSIMGVFNSISNCFGFIAPYITGVILHANPSLTGWKIVFLIPAGINIVVNLAYLIFAKADEMPWNRSKKLDPVL